MNNKIWHIPQLGNLEMHHASYTKQSFPKHTHEQYAFGVIEQGALGFYYRGENVIAGSGNISLCIPGEPHTGHPATEEGWQYRMLYFDASFIQQIASDLTNQPATIPYFKSGVIHDPDLARDIYNLHISLTSQPISLLAQETAMLQVFAKMIQRHADDPPPQKKIQDAHGSVLKVKRYIQEHHAEDLSLDMLSQVASLSRYHLIHTFTQIEGIPPHAYLRQERVHQAKKLLTVGTPIAATAVSTGFTDQSHLNRWFKRFWGYTPGQYRNSVQDQSIK